VKFYISPTHFAKKRRFIVRDANQEKAFEVKGRFLFGMRSLEMRTVEGESVYRIKRRYTLGIYRRYNVLDAQDKKAAELSKAYGLLRPRVNVTLDGEVIVPEGSLYQHRFSLAGAHIDVRMEKKVFPAGDAYEIDVGTSPRPHLCLFLLIAIDQFLHERKKIIR